MFALSILKTIWKSRNRSKALAETNEAKAIVLCTVHLILCLKACCQLIKNLLLTMWQRDISVCEFLMLIKNFHEFLTQSKPYWSLVKIHLSSYWTVVYWNSFLFHTVQQLKFLFWPLDINWFDGRLAQYIVRWELDSRVTHINL